jgi:6-phosphogluconate dehydrogenase
MAGGAESSWRRVESVLTAIAAKYEGEPCAAWLGPDGAGHFVKTIHNGIEYADMQMIAEVYGILRDGLGLAAGDIAPVFGDWNRGRLNSYLIEITAAVLAADDPRTGDPMVDVILDRAGQKGTGKWSAIEAQQLSVPATTIEAAVAARVLSLLKEERLAAASVYGKGGASAFPEDPSTFRQLELALFAGKIAAYAQGFAVMEAASKEFGWGLPMPTIARIWRAGCIIRSQFLGTLAEAFGSAGAANLLLTPAFVAMMQEAHPSLRLVVARAAEAGLPAPALGSALAYFDSYRQGRGTANLIQAQRDFFGAHGFERIDGPGAFHGPWGSGAAG